jgi:uncharacterized protein YkwD
VGIPAVRREPLLLLALLVALLALAGPAAGSTASARERALVAAVNEVRAEHGLRPVVLAPALLDEARSHARELLARNAFVHGRLRSGTAEMLAWGTRGVMGARSVVLRWMASPEHRAILLWPAARRAGTGFVIGRFQGETGVRIAVVRLSS